MLPNVWTESFQKEITDELFLEGARRFRRFQLPESKEEWLSRRKELLRRLKEKLPIEIDHSLPLDIRETSVIQLDGYSVRQICYQSRPGFYVTASLYVPDGKGPFPGVVMMHGHNRQGHLGARIQRIGHLLAPDGYAVISVDAFGAGERSTVHGEYEYHGNMLGGMLLNIGQPLMAMQIVDNMRAVDVLQSLPYVDSGRIGATGASGGGNQTMYLAAFDDRVKAAVPVVSVGSYQSYLLSNNCFCEVLPDGLDICEESAIIALIAPRAVKICNGLHDSCFSFTVPERARTVTEARKVFKALDAYGNLQFYSFNGPHGYPPDAEAEMHGFFDLHLKGKGHGLPVLSPETTPLPEEQLMVFPKGQRPPEVFSIPDYTHQQAEILKKTACGSVDDLRQILKVPDETILHQDYLSTEAGWQKYTLESSTGRMLPFLFRTGNPGRCMILAAPRGKSELEQNPLWQKAEQSGDSLLVFDPWSTGEGGNSDTMAPGHPEQHFLSRPLLWLGQRLMGNWAGDFLLAMDFIRNRMPQAALTLAGVRDSAVAALFAGLMAPAGYTPDLIMQDPPATLVYDGTPDSRYFTMACCIPDILKWGDLDHAAKLFNGHITLINPRRYDGTILDEKDSPLKSI